MESRAAPERSPAVDFPSGTVAFLFTDIEGSTARWERGQAAMWTAVERHFDLLRQAIAAERGVLFKTIGDAVQAAFPSVPAAVRAAIAAQHALHEDDFQAVGGLPVRMAIHVGEATPVAGDYLAPVLNRLARVLGVGYGEQILLTEAAAAVAGDLPDGYSLRDLGAHRLKDLLAAERVYQLVGPGLRGQFPALKSLERRLHNLPAQPTELIGREADLEHLRALLIDAGVRLVTLTGPGGSGKSRLAAQAAADLLDEFPDGVWWVPLAAVTDPSLVPQGIASALGLAEQPGKRLADVVAEHLRLRQTLLVLDNLEQVLAAAALVSELLDAAPRLVILATSREPLRLRAEREFPVAPLALPLAGRAISPDDAFAFPAVRLFVDRARAVRPDFALTEANAAAVVEICRQLDGLPLAIELAAARVRLLPPASLLARLEKRLTLLTGGARDLPERQQTLRATIAWSYDLLEAGERTLFARLAVFVGGCTLSAALAVAEAGSPPPIDLLDGLEGLVLKSLLRQEDGQEDEPRFTMLETICEFGLEQLAARPEEERAVRAAHAAYFRELLDAAGESEDPATAFGDLEREMGNLRLVLDWTARHGESAAALEFATNLRWFWWLRGHLREGQASLESALRATPSAAPDLRARALSGLGLLMEAGGDLPLAKAHYLEALALFREASDEPGIAEALDNLGAIAASEGELGESQTLREEALALRRAGGNTREIAGSLVNLGNVAYLRHETDRAIELYEEARQLSLETGDDHMLATALGNIGGALLQKARSETVDSTPAGEHFEAEAADLIAQALGIAHRLGDRERILDNLLTLAEIAGPADPVHAAELVGAAEALATVTGHQLPPIDQGPHTRLVASLREGLGDARYEQTKRDGARLTLDEAVAAAVAHVRKSARAMS